MKIILCARIYATFAVVKRKPEKKNSGLYGIRSLDLCDRCTMIAEVKGSNPVQAGIFFRLSFPNCKSCITAMIILHLSVFVFVVVVVLFCLFFLMKPQCAGVSRNERKRAEL